MPSAVLVLRAARQHQRHVPEGRLDLVAVEIPDETTVVRLAIVRAWPGLAFVATTGLQRRLVKGVHRGLVRGDEAEVAAVADGDEISAAKQVDEVLTSRAAAA